MKTRLIYILLTCLVLLFAHKKATSQNIDVSLNNYTIIPVNEFITYLLNEDLEYPENPYFKDVNGDLDSFIGTWKGTANGKTFELTTSKITTNDDGVALDELIIRYKVTGSSDEIIINTYNHSLSNPLIVGGYFLANDKSYYCFNYDGEKSGCGAESGWFYMNKVVGNPNAMQFKYKPWGKPSPYCDEISTVELFPLSMQLTKQ